MTRDHTDDSNGFHQQTELNEAIAEHYDAAAEAAPAETEVGDPASGPEADSHGETMNESRSERDDAQDAAEQAAPPPVEADASQDGGEPAPPSTLAPPAHFNNAEKKLFAGLDEKAQGLVRDVMRRSDREVSRYRAELDRRAARYDGFDELFAPRAAQLSAQGLTPPEAVGQLLALSDYAAADPAGFIGWFARERQIDLADITSGETGTGAQMPAAAASPDIAALQAQVGALNRQFSHRQQAEMAQHRRTAEQELNEFRTATGADGTPLYPYADDLEKDMAERLRSGSAATLEDAYNQAAWANPVVRNALLADRDAAAEAERDKQDRHKAERARRASLSLDGGIGGVDAAVPLSLRDSLERKFNAY